MAESYRIEGTVAAGYESVKEMFTEFFSLGSDKHSQVCVYVGEEKVIDLWGTTGDNSNYNADSLTTVFSSSKNLTALVMAMAKDRGWLDYSDKISKHWPEFGQQGKEDIMIADLMRHEAGLASFPIAFDYEDLLTENVKKNSLGSKIATFPPQYPAHGKRQYHSITRGWIANEIFRRVDPDHRTIGEFLQMEVASKLGADVYIGCDLSNYCDVENIDFWFALKESLKHSLGYPSASEISFGEFMFSLQSIIRMGQPIRMIKEFEGLMDFNTLKYRTIEIPSANANCSARGLALVGAMLANKGVLKGTRVLSEEAWAAMHANPTEGKLFGDISYPFTQGGVAKFGGLREGYYGWFGYGGSVFQWNPTDKVGFAYTCSQLFWVRSFNVLTF